MKAHFNLYETVFRCIKCPKLHLCYFAEVGCLKRKLSSKLFVDEQGSVLEWEVNAFSYMVHFSIFVKRTNSRCLGGRMHWNVVAA